MLKHLVKATKFALDGIIFGLKHERALAIEIFIVVTILPFITMLGNAITDKILLLGSLVLVLITEFLNTAIEKTVDRISHTKHPLSKIAKDCGAAAVLLSVIFAVITWVLILFCQ